jgi:diguanylate cyclase (GGDEF)-like protein
MKEGDLIGQTFVPLTHPDDAAMTRAQFIKVLHGGPGATVNFETRLRHVDGSWRTLETVLTNLLDDPDVRAVVSNSRDVTERRALEKQLNHQAFHDSLTGLANRALFLDRVGHALDRADRQVGPVGVMFVDIDHFKVVNDSLGHHLGDGVLFAVAERLTASTRPGDTVARLGGDEFAVLLEQFRDETEGRAHPVACDVTDSNACRTVVEAAVGHLGGLDGLIYAPGVAAVTQLRDAVASQWRTELDTNLVSAALVTAAAIPHLEASGGWPVYLSSVSAHLNPPWIGFGIYLVSKVALEKSAQVWKLEHPRVRFTTIVVGSTSDNEFFDHADIPDPDQMQRFAREWATRGYLSPQQLAPSDHADAIVHLLTSRA